MQLDETYIQANNQLEDLIYNGGLLEKAAYGILCCLCIYLLLYALSKKMKRHWESTNYIILCAGMLFFAACTLLSEFFQTNTAIMDMLGTLRYIGIIIAPTMLCLHIRQQVSYKELRIVDSLLLYVPPSFFIIVLLRDAFISQAANFISAINDTPWIVMAFYAFTIVVVIRSYLLCFNVFYQMPRHMRRSTRYMLLSISAFALVLALDVLWRNTFVLIVPPSDALDALLPIGAPLGFGLLLFPLHSAMHLMPAEDVIVTSREFVVGGLSTTILVLGRKMQILDWNRKVWDDGYPLPKPLYKEPIEVYRRRIVEQNPFRISPHDSNIITAVYGSDEMHFLMQTREIHNRKRHFGYVLEISEITRVYTMMRLFEEIAHFDQLTKLHNRNAYLSYVQESIVEENMPLLIFVGDVNGLKTLNDNHGHLIGDQLLKAVADIISEAAPPDAFTARVGGDEYVMLVPNGTDEMANQFVQDVISLCSITTIEQFGSPSISWGYAIMTSIEQSYNDIFDSADAMMYAYKKGRNQFSSSGLLPENPS